MVNKILQILNIISSALRISEKYFSDDLRAEGSAEYQKDDLYKIDLVLSNKINSTLKVTEISTVFPEYSAICPLAGVRKNPDDDIPDIKRLSSTIEPDLLIPTNDKINYRLFIHTDRKALSSVSINVATLNMDKQKKKKKVKKVYIII